MKIGDKVMINREYKYPPWRELCGCITGFNSNYILVLFTRPCGEEYETGFREDELKLVEDIL